MVVRFTKNSSVSRRYVCLKYFGLFGIGRIYVVVYFSLCHLTSKDSIVVYGCECQLPLNSTLGNSTDRRIGM